MEDFKQQLVLLEKAYRRGVSNAAGETRLEAMKALIVRRNIEVEGAPNPSNYNRCVTTLLMWAQRENLFELAEGGKYVVVEGLSDAELKEAMEDRGLSYEASEDSRSAAEEDLDESLLDEIKEERRRREGREEQKELFLHDESHEKGIMPLAPLPIACYRTHYPWNESEVEPQPLEAALLELTSGASLLVARWAKEGDRPWQLDKEPMLVVAEAVGVGVPRTSEAGVLAGLETVEVCPPHTYEILDPEEWQAMPVVETIHEAIALAKAKGAGVLWMRQGGDQKIDLNQVASWNGNAFDEHGASVLGSVPRGKEATTGWDELLKLSGARADVLLREDKRKLADALVDATAEAMYALSLEQKGQGKELLPVPMEELGKGRSPVDGSVIGEQTSQMQRLMLAEKVGKMELAGSGPALSTFTACERHWWCLLCNVALLAKRLGLQFTAEQVRKGEVRFTTEARAEIRALQSGHTKCSCPSAGKGGEYAMPPFNALVQCPGCKVWINTPEEVPLSRCGKCALPFGTPGAIDFKQAARESGLLAEKTVEKVKKERDEQRFHYLREAGGVNEFEKAGHPTETLVEMQMAMNEVRGEPENLEGGILECVITDRLMALLPTGRWDELSLWDFQPADYAQLAALSKYSSADLASKLKTASGSGGKRPLCLLEKGCSNASLIRYMHECHAIKLRVSAMCWGFRFDGDPEVAAKMLKSEVSAPVNAGMYTEPSMVWALYTATDKNFSSRLEKQCQQPHISMLHDYERRFGNCIRPLPCLASAEFIRAVPLALEQQQRSFAVQSMSAKDKEVPWMTKQDGSSKGKQKVHSEVSEPQTDTGAEDFKAAGETKPAPRPKDGVSKGMRAQWRKNGRFPKQGKSQQIEIKAQQMEITPGDLGGEASPTAYKKLLAKSHYSAEGLIFCPRKQTAMGCEDEFCCMDPKVLGSDFWSAEWHLLFLMQGGHVDWEGQLPLSKVTGLLSAEQAVTVTMLGEAAGTEMLRFHLARRLAHMVKATAEPLEFTPVQSGDTRLFRRELWGEDAPFKVSSSSGVVLETVSRVIVGVTDALFNCIAEDQGEVIQVKREGTLLPPVKAMCGIKAVACHLGASKKWTPDVPGETADSVLLQEIVDELVDIDPDTIKEGNRLAQIYFAWSMMLTKGIPDKGFMIVNPDSLKGASLFQVQVSEDGEEVGYHWNLPVSRTKCKAEFTYNAENGGQLKGRNMSATVRNGAVIPTLISGTEEGDQPTGRHSEHLKLSKDMTSATDLMAKMRLIVEGGKATLVVSERGTQGTRNKLNRADGRPGLGWVSKAMIQQAHGRLKTAKRMVGEGRASLQGAELTVQPDDGEGVQKLQQQVEGWRREAMERATKAKLLEKVRGEAREQKQTREQLVEEWEMWHADRMAVNGKGEVEPLLTHSDFMRMWKLHYVPWLQQVPEGTPREKVLVFSGRYMNEWLMVEPAKGKSERQHLEDMTAAYRGGNFGGRQGAGPQWEEMEELFGGALAEGHLNVLKETTQKGADPLFLDLWNGEGTTAEQHPHTSEIVQKILEDQVTELKERRALIFDQTQEGITEFLLKAGVRLAPVVTAEKTDPDGRVRKTASGEDVLRICVDCRETVNGNLFAGDHTAQKTTSPQIVVQGMLREEQRYPHHQLRVVKDDMVAAFHQVAHTLRRVGLFATSALDFACVYLTMIFGSGASPGDFDPLGDAIIQTVIAQVRDVDGDDEAVPTELQAGAGPKGELHPEARRFVDDVISLIAMFGDRIPDHQARLRRIVRALLGMEGLNIEKQGEEGQPTSFKHAFGVVINTVARLVGAPWSKIVKLKELATPIINGEEDMDYERLAKLRGVADHVLLTAPGLHRVLLPRLDAGLAHAGSQYPGAGVEGRRIPPGTKISCRLKGETKQQALKMLKRALNLVVRLGGIRKGALFRLSWEALLPRELRTTWPGREGPSSQVRFLMDASGTSLFLIDLSTGKFLRVVFTGEEQALFNDFTQEHGTTINDRELLSELFGIVMLAHMHPRQIIDMVNDNTAAQHWTDSSKHRSAKTDQVLSVIGIFELLLKITVWGSRVKSEDNFADTGTRMEARSRDYEEGLRELEQQHGWKAEEVQLEPWLRQMGWTALESETDDGRWFLQAVKAVEHLEATAPGLAEECCGVPVALVLEQLQEAWKGTSIRGDWVSDGDFPAASKSKERLQLTAEVRHTQNQLRKKLRRLEIKHGKEAGGIKFNVEMGASPEVDPQRTLNGQLQLQREESYNMLSQKNINFDGTRRRESKEVPQVQKWEPPPGHRVAEDGVCYATAFTGIAPFGKAAKAMGVGSCKFTAELNPELREWLEEDEPDAIHFSDVKELYVNEELPGLAEVLFSSPICVEFSTANLYKQGNSEKLMGCHWQEGGDMAEFLGVAVACFECTIHVLDKGKAGEASATEELEKRLPSFHLDILKVDAGKTKSPMTGEQSGLRHIRVHGLARRKSVYVSTPKVDYNQAVPLKSFEHILDEPWEAERAQVMPQVDQHGLVLNFRRSKEGAAYMGTIFEPERGRGHHEFVNEVVDPCLGRMPPFTGTGGGVWMARQFNGLASFLKPSLREGFRAYCARGIRPELLRDDSALGQSVCGNMIPQNVADWLFWVIMLDYTRIQEDGWTAQEKWRKERDAMGKEREARGTFKMEESSCGRKRPTVEVINPEVDARVEAVIQLVQSNGKRPKTLEAYAAGMRDWVVLADAKGWCHDLSLSTDLKTAQEAVRYFCAHEKSEYGLKARSIRSKLSGVRWWHVKNLKGNPLEKMDGVYAWLADLEKMDGPASPKAPVPITLILLLLMLLEEAGFDGVVKSGALLVGFWLLLRSAEYLRGDGEEFDPQRSLTWGDLICRVIEGDKRTLVNWEKMEVAMTQKKVCEITATLLSDKNSLKTCTRTVRAVHDSEACMVKGLVKLHAAVKGITGKEPQPEAAVFMLESGKVLSRAELGALLKAAAVKVGVPQAKVSTHSLRRGGACAYVASGKCTEEAVMRFGRWCSLAYHQYVFPHSELMAKALDAASKMVPRFEKN